jgi:hypothetical protein
MTHYPRYRQRLQSEEQSCAFSCLSVFRSIVILSVFKCVVHLLACLSDAPIPPRPEQGISQRGLNGFHLRCSCRAREPGLGVLLMIMENDVSPPVIGFLRAPVIKVTSTMYDTVTGRPESAVARFVEIWSTSLSYAVALFHRFLLTYSTSLLTCERRTHRMQHVLQRC